MSRVLQRKVAQCFLLNGLIFMGSMLVLQYAAGPAMHWLLHAALSGWASSGTVKFLDAALVALYTYVWLWPAYAISLLVNLLWYVSRLSDDAY